MLADSATCASAVCLIEGTVLFLPSTVIQEVQNASDTLFRYEVGCLQFSSSLSCSGPQQSVFKPALSECVLT